MVQALFRTQLQCCGHLPFACPRVSWHTGFNILCYFQSGGNSGKERQTHTKAVRQAVLQGPSVSQQQPCTGGQQKGRGAALGFSCHCSVRIILMKDKLFPPIPGLLQSPFHIHLQFKEIPNRGRGERGRAWVIDHARGSHHLKADQKTEQGASLTRELVSVTRCNASVTSTRVGGSLEAWITWGREKDSVTASWQGLCPQCLAAHEQHEHPLALDSRKRGNSRSLRRALGRAHNACKPAEQF